MMTTTTDVGGGQASSSVTTMKEKEKEKDIACTTTTHTHKNKQKKSDKPNKHDPQRRSSKGKSKGKRERKTQEDPFLIAATALSSSMVELDQVIELIALVQKQWRVDKDEQERQLLVMGNTTGTSLMNKDKLVRSCIIYRCR